MRSTAGNDSRPGRSRPSGRTAGTGTDTRPTPSVQEDEGKGFLFSVSDFFNRSVSGEGKITWGVLLLAAFAVFALVRAVISLKYFFG